MEAYKDAPLTDFKFDHLDIQAASAGSIADAKDWSFSDDKLTIADGSAVRVTDSTNVTGLPAAAAPTPASAAAPAH